VNQRVKGSPFQQLHRDEQFVTVLTNFVDGADVRMVERGGGPGLGLEQFYGVKVFLQRKRKKLQGDTAAESQVLGLIKTPIPPAPIHWRSR
jgi:hypothetical protein